MIILASDHGGFELKEKIKEYLSQNNEVVDVGAFEYDEKDDYPRYAKLAMNTMKDYKNARAIVVCGSGIGVNITCNRFKGVYAAVGISPKQIALARRHNNINVLNLSGRSMNIKKAKKIIDAFLTVDFEGGRHIRRIKAIDTL